MESIMIEEAVDNNYLFQKQMEMMVETSTKKLVNEIESLKSRVVMLSEELIQLRKELGNVKNARPSSMRIADEPTISQSVNVVEVRQEQQKPKTNEQLRPRYGDYKPEDVAIDKMFYFGNKK